MTVRRMAADKRIPGAKSTKGGHYYFPASKAFSDWLAGELEAKAKLVKERRKQLREKAALPKMPSPEIAFLRIGDCFAASSNLIQAAYRSQKRLPLSRWPPELKDRLIASLAPLETIAKELRG